MNPNRHTITLRTVNSAMSALAIEIEVARANIANPLWAFCIEDTRKQETDLGAAYDALEQAAIALNRIIDFEQGKAFDHSCRVADELAAQGHEKHCLFLQDR